MDRRNFLATAGSVAAFAPFASVGAMAGGEASPDEALRLHLLLEGIFEALTADSPQSMTALGLDRGKGAWARYRLDDASGAAVERAAARRREWLAELGGIRHERLRGVDRLNYQALAWQLSAPDATYDRLSNGVLGSIRPPYVVTPLAGSYRWVPDFLEKRHPVASQEDADAFLVRLSQFATVLDQETERVGVAAADGIVPPRFAIERTLDQLHRLRPSVSVDAPLARSFGRKAAPFGPRNWSDAAAALLREGVAPALDRQMTVLARLRAAAPEEVGIWRLPRGEEIYAAALRSQTTVPLNPATLHEEGRHEVAEISAAVDRLLRAQGLSQGTVGRRIAALAADPRFVVPDDDAGRAKIMQLVDEKVAQMRGLMPSAFSVLPKARLEIRRVPREIEVSTSGAYYLNPSFDGSIPGAFYISLRDTREWPLWLLPSVVFHEAMPGHHAQIALAQEARHIPDLRRVTLYGGYSEGWGLYAEKLADELGAYEQDPLGRIGLFRSLLLRAARVVADTGIHAHRWSRAEALRYMSQTVGDVETNLVTEIERYCVWPAQAVTYNVGYRQWLALRAATAPGGGEQRRRFHSGLLALGPLPFPVLKGAAGEIRSSVAS